MCVELAKTPNVKPDIQGYVMIFRGICPYPVGPNTLYLSEPGSYAFTDNIGFLLGYIEPNYECSIWANPPQFCDPSLLNSTISLTGLKV